MSEQTYDEARSRRLEELLRALARRIQELDQAGSLLSHTGEISKLTGDVRSELFHYEVRATYDTPEVARNRQIVADALRMAEKDWDTQDWKPEQDNEEE